MRDIIGLLLVLVLLVTASVTNMLESFINGLPLVDEIKNAVNLKNIFTISNTNLFINLAYFLLVLFISGKLVDKGLTILLGSSDKDVKKAYPLTTTAIKIIAFIVTDGFINSTNINKPRIIGAVNSYASEDIDIKIIISIGFLIVSIALALMQFRDIVFIAILMMAFIIYVKNPAYSYGILLIMGLWVFFKNGITRYVKV